MVKAFLKPRSVERKRSKRPFASMNTRSITSQETSGRAILENSLPRWRLRIRIRFLVQKRSFIGLSLPAVADMACSTTASGSYTTLKPFLQSLIPSSMSSRYRKRSFQKTVLLSSTALLRSAMAPPQGAISSSGSAQSSAGWPRPLSNPYPSVSMLAPAESIVPGSPILRIELVTAPTAGSENGLSRLLNQFPATLVSLLRRTMNSESVSAEPALFAPVKPVFRSRNRPVTMGHCIRMCSCEPSEEPLSTTITDPGLSTWGRSEDRQVSSRCFPLK